MNNPVVVISGATGNTGALAARAFAEQGAALVLLSSNQAKLEALTADLNLPAGRLFTQVMELSDSQAVNAAAGAVHSKFGRVDILLHLVGGWTGGQTLAEMPAETLESMISQHLWTSFHLVRAFTPGMLQNGWGRVVFVSSPLATQPTAGMGAYSIAKAAEDTLLLTLAQEFRESRATANLIQVRSIDASGSGKGTPAGDIIAAILYLCSEQAGRINGARIPLFS
jgi:NAD(P)-dependent dehydrogenase (short-subunit alcohol dehydrogenase family)